jgi:hypothetical protein
MGACLEPALPGECARAIPSIPECVSQLSRTVPLIRASASVVEGERVGANRSRSPGILLPPSTDALATTPPDPVAFGKVARLIDRKISRRGGKKELWSTIARVHLDEELKLSAVRFRWIASATARTMASRSDASLRRST